MQEREFELDFGALDKVTIPEVESFEDFANQTESEEGETIKAKVKEEVLDNFNDEDLEDDSHLQNSDNQGNNQDEGVESLREIAKWGHELGIFDYDEEKFEPTEDYFKEKFFEKVRKEAVEAVPEEFRNIMSAYAKGVPLKELLTSQAREESFSSIDENSISEDERLQEDLVTQYLSLQDYDEDEIKDKLETYKDSLILEKEAKTALKKLKKYETTYRERLSEEAEKRERQSELQAKEALDNLKKDIQTTESFIPGITMSKEQKENLFVAITRRDREGKTELEKKMSDKQMQLAVAQFVLQLEGKLDAIERKAASKATSKVKEVLNSDTRQTKGAPDLNLIRKAINSSKRKF